MLQDSPSLLGSGLLLAQVPENFPSFFSQILIAIPATAIAKSPMVSIASFISLELKYKFTKPRCNYLNFDYDFLNFKLTEFTQYLVPDFVGPSLKTCPRWLPHELQIISVRVIPCDLSNM